MPIDEDELLRFKNIVATIALEHPDMNMQEGIRLALQVEEELAHRPDLTQVNPYPSVKSPMDIAQWVWDNRTKRAECANAIDYIGGHRAGTISAGKIYAIKEVRGVTGAGLKEAKEAVELIQHAWPARPGLIPPF